MNDDSVCICCVLNGKQIVIFIVGLVNEVSSIKVVSVGKFKDKKLVLILTGQAEAGKANTDVLPVLQCEGVHPAMYGCGCSWLGYSTSRLDCPVRSPR